MGVSEVTLVGNVEVVEVEGEKAKAHKAKYEYDRVADFSIGLQDEGEGGSRGQEPERAQGVRQLPANDGGLGHRHRSRPQPLRFGYDE